jgi:hypothetical protein
LLSSGLLAGVAGVPAVAAPQGGTVRAGTATIAVNGAQTRVDQASERAVIDWRGVQAAVAGGRGVVLYSGGRGVAQSADLGRSGSYGRTRAAPDESDERHRRVKGRTTGASARAKETATTAAAAPARPATR